MKIQEINIQVHVHVYIHTDIDQLSTYIYKEE